MFYQLCSGGGGGLHCGGAFPPAPKGPVLLRGEQPLSLQKVQDVIFSLTFEELPAFCFKIIGPDVFVLYLYMFIRLWESQLFPMKEITLFGFRKAKVKYFIQLI